MIAVMSTVGIHLITTTFGTWLPGDDRGHWSALFDVYGQLNQRGGQLNPPSQSTQRHAQSLMREPVKTLDDVEQVLVASVIEKLVAGSGTPAKAGAKWVLPICYAAAIEATHIHLLLGPVAEPLDRFVGRIKGMTSGAVSKLPQNVHRQHTWTTGYWKVFFYREQNMHAVRDYIEQHNLRRGHDAQRFAFVRPSVDLRPDPTFPQSAAKC